MTVQLLQPWGLLALLALPVVLYYGWTSFDDAPPARRRLALGLRCLVLVLVAVELAGLRLTMPTRPRAVCTQFLVDVSDSQSDANVTAACDYVTAAVGSAGRHDLAGLVTFAGAPTLASRPQSRPDAAALVTQIRAARARKEKGAAGRGATDVATAVELVLAAYPEGPARRLVVLSDLNATTSGGGPPDPSLAGVAEACRRRGVEVCVKLLDRADESEVLVSRFEVPSRVKLGEAFNVRAEVVATRPCQGLVTLYRNGFLVARQGTPEAPLALVAGTTPVTFRQTVNQPGRLLYAVKIEPVGEFPDRPENNQVYGFAEARGAPRVLLLAADDEESRELEAALRQAHFAVESRGRYGLPTTMLDLQDFAVVYYANLPASELSENQVKLIHDYVYDFGGAFVMLGGKQSFGAGGYAGTAIEDLLPVRMTTTRREAPSLGIVIIADTSRSMYLNPTPREWVTRTDLEAALKRAAGQLHEPELRQFLAQMGERIEGRRVLESFWRYWDQRTPDAKNEPEAYQRLEQARRQLAGLGGINKTGMVQAAVGLVISQLGERDQVGVVSLGGIMSPPSWVLPLSKAVTPGELGKQAMGRLAFETQSHLNQSFQLALEALSKTTATRRQIILISDGFIPGDADTASDPGQQGWAYAAQCAADNISVSTVGIGADCNRQFLERVARWGNGRCYIAGQEQELGAAFTRELAEIQLNPVIEGPNQAEPRPRTDGGQGPYPVLRGLNFDLAPHLFGYVRTRAKLGAAVPLVMPPEGDPLLATWTYGKGRAAAFTADARRKWAAAWVEDWPRGFNTLFAQLTTELLPTPGRARLLPDLHVDGRILDLATDAVDENGAFLSRLCVNAEVFYLGPRGQVYSAGSRQTTALPLLGPGRYGARHEVNKDGIYLVRLVATDEPGAEVGQETVGVVVTASAELAGLRANTVGAEALTAATGGRLNPEPAEAFARATLSRAVAHDLGRPLLLLALALFTADCVTRRWPAWALWWKERRP